MTVDGEFPLCRRSRAASARTEGRWFIGLSIARGGGFDGHKTVQVLRFKSGTYFFFQMKKLENLFDPCLPMGRRDYFMTTLTFGISLIIVAMVCIWLFEPAFWTELNRESDDANLSSNPIVLSALLIAYPAGIIWQFRRARSAQIPFSAVWVGVGMTIMTSFSSSGPISLIAQLYNFIFGWMLLLKPVKITKYGDR